MLPNFSDSCCSRFWAHLDCWLLWTFEILSQSRFEDCSQKCSESNFCSHCVSNERTCLLFGPASVAMVDAWVIVDALTPVEMAGVQIFFRLSSGRLFVGPKQSHWKTTKHSRWKRFRLAKFVARKHFFWQKGLVSISSMESNSLHENNVLLQHSHAHELLFFSFQETV